VDIHAMNNRFEVSGLSNTHNNGDSKWSNPPELQQVLELIGRTLMQLHYVYSWLFNFKSIPM